MKLFHMVLAAAVAMSVAAPLQAQMSSMTQMGGGSYTTNLISPPTADTQIGRGMLMISQAMPGMRGMPMGTPGTGGNARGLRIRMILSGVNSQNALVTSSGNHLYVVGSLTSADGTSQPVSVDQLFDINGGTAVLYVPLTLPSFTLPATLQIENVAVADANGHSFGVSGLRMSAVSTHPTMTPGMHDSTMTPGMHDSTMTPGMHDSTMTPGMHDSTMTPGMHDSTMTPGMHDSTMTPGMGATMTMTPGMGGSTMTPGMGAIATMTPGMHSSTMPRRMGGR
jgi:hypothetical protein